MIDLVASPDALVALRLPGQQPLYPQARRLSHVGEHPVLAQTAQWLDRYFAGEAVSPGELPLRPEGTPFQRLIFSLLLEIPWGSSCTYGALAGRAARILGKASMSAQAVGHAAGANPICVIIPCHRCLGAGNTLTGFAGGVELKRKLLELEHIPHKDR